MPTLTDPAIRPQQPRGELAAAPDNIASAIVESQADRSRPGRTAYSVTGPTREVVQSEIDRLMATVEADGVSGLARFTRPMLVDGAWLSLGETIVAEAVA